MEGVLLPALLIALVLLAAAPAQAPAPASSPRPELPAPGELARAAGALGAGPRLIAGVPVRGVARVDMAGTRSAGRTVLVVGCLDAARCAGSGLVTRALAGCPPVDLDLWTVPGLRGGARREGWRAMRRLVADARPRLTLLYTRRGPAEVRARAGGRAAAQTYARRSGLRLGGDSGPEAGWVERAMPGTVVLEVALPDRPAGAERRRHLRALRAATGVLDPGEPGP